MEVVRDVERHARANADLLPDRDVANGGAWIENGYLGAGIGGVIGLDGSPVLHLVLGQLVHAGDAEPGPEVELLVRGDLRLDVSTVDRSHLDGRTG
jgi:hypothetical protein